MSSKTKRKTTRTMRKNNVRTIARQEAKAVLRRNIELKEWFGDVTTTLDWDGAAYAITADPVTATQMVQGVTRQDYIGDTIKPVSLSITFSVRNLEVTSEPARFIILQVKGGGTPSPANVLESTTNPRTPLSYYDPQYKDTFRVLYDSYRVFQPQGDHEGQGWRKKIKARMNQIHFTGPSGVIEANGLWLVVYGTSVGGSHGMECRWRLAYTDA